ncbi:MAG TPA: glycosyltransferase family 39 protein, partial [Gemmataceae bacterium]|nr:glycosyltransferase family 39 protein [Gemmataceae bacterium]
MSIAPTVSQVVERIAEEDRNPPFCGLIVHFALQFGQSEFTMRIASLIAGVATIAIAWLLGKSCLGPTGGIILTLLCTFSPIYVFYSREARPYALGIAFLFLFLLALHRFMEDTNIRSAGWLGLTSIGCVLTQYAASVIVAVAMMWGLIVIAHGGKLSRRFLAYWSAIGAASVGALAACYVYLLRRQLAIQG